jgi:outer membrane protein assembly factor BamA
LLRYIISISTFKNNFLKQIPFLVIYLLFINLANCQNHRLQITYKEFKSSDTDSIKEVLVNNGKALYIIDSISTSLMKKGFLGLVALKNKRINDTLHTLQMVLNRKYTHIAIVKEHTLIDKKIVKTVMLSRKRNLFTIQSIETYLSQHNATLIQNGYPFAETKLSDLILKDSDTIEASLLVSRKTKRYINRIIVKGYQKFPKRLISDFSSPKQVYNSKTIATLEQSLKSIPFIKQTKEAEVLFKKDSTSVFLYLEKIKTNTAEGLIGFNNSTNDQLELNGFVNLKLQNNLDRGETFLLAYRNDNGDQTQFSTSIDLPYLWKTAIGLNSSLRIQRRDSTYQRTSLNAGLFYKPNWNSSIGLNYNNENSTATGDNIDTEDFIKNGIEVQAELIKITADRLMPENLVIRTRLGINNRELENENEKQFNFHATFLKLWHLNKRSMFFNKLTSYYLQSNNIKFNELYQFGGLGSIRGFNQNSIDSSFYTTLATEYRYRLNNQIYLHSILDIAVFENFNTKKLDKLYSYGAGIAILTQAGILNLSIANGRFEDAKVDLSSTVAHINLLINF